MRLILQFLLGLPLMLLLQSLPFPTDPSKYPASWGLTGALVFVIVLLSVLVYVVFFKGSQDAQRRTQQFMDYVSDHSDKHTQALTNLATTISTTIKEGDDRIAGALEASAKASRAIMVAWEALARARAQKAGGGALTPLEIDQILRSSREDVERKLGN